MLHSITNGTLTVEVNSMGAELHSIKTADGTEYLWQGNPEYWKGQAPNLFPYVARLTDETYELEGRQYHMKIHGFVRWFDLEAEKPADGSTNQITFILKDNADTYAQFPFHFEYRITYALEGSKLLVMSEVMNEDDRPMYFGIGGHPGFNVPMEEGLSFTDYYLEFGDVCHPYRVGFTEDCHVNGQDEIYPLVDGRKLPLQHDLFDHDAVVLKHADRKVTIRSDKGTRAVEVSYPDYPYVGFWHMPKTDAPYVCVEPWASLPSRKDIIENFAQQADLIHLNPGAVYNNDWEIRIIE